MMKGEVFDFTVSASLLSKHIGHLLSARCKLGAFINAGEQETRIWKAFFLILYDFFLL